MCTDPMPDSRISLVSLLRVRESDGSSSMSLEKEEKALSSSPCFLVSTAKVTMGLDGDMTGKRMGLASEARVSPVTVSFSLATAPKAPGPRWLTDFCPLPSGRKSWP